MAHTTLLLDTETWDLLLDVDGNIAVASLPYSLEQDAASAIRLRLGEQWFDTTIGVNYDAILGKNPPVALLKSAFTQAALTVPDVVGAACFLTGITNRLLSGQVQVEDETGKIAAAAF